MGGWRRGGADGGVEGVEAWRAWRGGGGGVEEEEGWTGVVSSFVFGVSRSPAVPSWNGSPEGT